MAQMPTISFGDPDATHGTLNPDGSITFYDEVQGISATVAFVGGIIKFTGDLAGLQVGGGQVLG